MSSVRISHDGDRVTLCAPYNPAMAPAAKRIGGRWRPTSKAWSFDARDEQRVRELAIELYGTDGSHDPTDLVTVRAAGREDAPWEAATCTVAGRIVAQRRARDEQVHLAEGVVIVEGGFAPSGGSRANPALGDDEPVLEIRDVPRQVALTLGLEIVEETLTERQRLESERDQLLARLARIEEALDGTR